MITWPILGRTSPHVPRPPSEPRSGSGRRRSRPGSKYSTGRDSRPGSGFTNVPAEIEVAIEDEGRRPGMPECPIVIVIGKEDEYSQLFTKTLK